jgi:hypothetical protein
VYYQLLLVKEEKITKYDQRPCVNPGDPSVLIPEERDKILIQGGNLAALDLGEGGY